MKRKTGARALAIGTTLAGVGSACAAGLLGVGDSIIGIDLDPPSSNSSYPAGEAPGFAVDGTLAKYLNFGGPGSGLIVTPNLPSSSIAKGLQLTTANDAEGRDPTSYELWGTNDAIISADNSAGVAENWSLISSGSIALPSARDTLGSVVSFSNSDLYTSYKFVFPTNKGDGLFQIAEVELIGDVPGQGVFDSPLLNAGDPTLAIESGPDSRFPGAEGPQNLLDDDPGTKYLNFGQANSGFIVTPASGASVVENFQMVTANDFPERDPTSWAIYGTNDPITSPENSQGNLESWTLIGSGAISLPVERMADGPIVPLTNTTAYTSYRVVFPSLVDESGLFPADSMQVSGFQFNVPEPSSAALCLLGVGLATSRRRRSA